MRSARAPRTSLNQPFLSGSQTLKAVVLALGMASLFELLFRSAWKPGWMDGWMCARQNAGAPLSAYRAHTMMLPPALAVAAARSGCPHSGGRQLSGRDELGYRVAVSAGVGLGPWNADHPTFGTALIKLCIGAGRLLGSGNLGACSSIFWRRPSLGAAGCRLQPDARARALARRSG
ncbi:MAG: hypothetical protein ACLVB5_06480 [Christensenellales bacterium]